MPKVSRYVTTLNKDQQRALKALFDRQTIWVRVGPGHDRPMRYREFRKTARVDHLLGCAMVHWCGMWIGIEADGHTHS